MLNKTYQYLKETSVNKAIEYIANYVSQQVKQGQTIRIVVKREMEVYKQFRGVHKVEKESTYSMQLSDYARRKEVREALEKGERENPNLPKYVKRSFKVNGIRFFEGFNGQYYFPLPTFGENHKSKWFLDGKEVEYSKVESLLTSSSKPKKQDKKAMAEKGQVPFTNPKIENIAAII